MLLLLSFVHAQWYFSSQPISLACQDFSKLDPLIPVYHETIFNSNRANTDSCIQNGWNSHFELEKNQVVLYNNCKPNDLASVPFIKQKCDLECNKFAIPLNRNSKVSLSTQKEWEESCQTIAMPIDPRGIHIPGYYNNYSIFTANPQSFFQMNRYSGSDCQDETLEQLHLYPKYDTCTLVNQKFGVYMISSVNEWKFVQSYCTDSSCNVCIDVSMEQFGQQCSLVDGYTYKNMGVHRYRSFWFNGSSVTETIIETKGLDRIMIAELGFGLLIIACVISILYYSYRARQRKMNEWYRKDSLKSAIAAKQAKLKINIDPLNSVAKFVPIQSPLYSPATLSSTQSATTFYPV